MKISNYMNNTNSIMEKNTDKVQKGNSQTNEKHTVGQSVKLSIMLRKAPPVFWQHALSIPAVRLHSLPKAP